MPEILHDCREMEAPEPLVTTLRKASDLKEGEVLRMIHRMEPCILYERLERLGCAWKMEQPSEDEVHIRIWRQEA